MAKQSIKVTIKMPKGNGVGSKRKPVRIVRGGKGGRRSS